MSIASNLVSELKDVKHLGLQFPARHILRFFGRTFELHITGGLRFTVRTNSSDVATIRQVFRDNEYGLEGLPQQPEVLREYESILARGRTPLIIDAGANIGAASVYFSKMYPKARIVALEPDADNAQICSKNILPHKQIVLRTCAIGGRLGHVAIKDPSAEHWARQTIRAPDSPQAIEVLTIDEICSQHTDCDLFIVKIDIEGFESDLFSAALKWIDSFVVLYIEPHDWMPAARNSSKNLQKALFGRGGEMVIRGENLVFFNP